MSIGIVGGMIVCGWIFLCVLSSERERTYYARQLEIETSRSKAGGSDTSDVQPLLDTAKN